MGYTISIGEAVIDNDIDHKLEYRHCGIGVTGVTIGDAPAFGEPTDYTNSKWPSYSGWADFAESTGLKDFFYQEEYGVLSSHPGSVPIDDKDLKMVQGKLQKYKMQLKGQGKKAIPALWSGDIMEETPPNGGDQNLGRLIWLEYWMRWAIENCENPVIANS